jgi:hypothetical protein
VKRGTTGVAVATAAVAARTEDADEDAFIRLETSGKK